MSQLALIALTLLADSAPSPPPGAAIRARIASDAQAGKPLVAHVIVALCDNRYQGIVPVPRRLGNGQDPRSNLYWGAAYGVRTYFPRRGGWQTVSHTVQLTDADHLASSGTNAFYKTNGELYRTGCSTSIGQRFK